MNTLLFAVNGLFDFDLTFPLEALLFAFFSFFLTSFFLNPLSKQINQREIFLEYGLKKAILFFNLGYEELTSCIEIVTDEIEELERQTSRCKEILSEKFEKEILTLQKESSQIVTEAKGELKIRSTYLFPVFLPEFSKTTDFFFIKKLS